MFCQGVVFIVLLGVKQSVLEVLGTEVDLKIRPGDNVTLYSDCVWTSGSHSWWFRNCSHYRQPSFNVSTKHLFSMSTQTTLDSNIPRYTFHLNSSSNSHDLVIENITESDLGVYYCSISKKIVVDEGVIKQTETHHFSKIIYKLSFEGFHPTPPPSSHLPPDGGQYWILLVILCTVCTLLSTLISSTCVYCLCRKTAHVKSGVHLTKRDTRGTKQDEDKEVCYTSLDMPYKAKPKKKINQNSDFSTYSEVRTHH
ncbi:uncharacterized protein LOC134098305 [Sardina pilchardus]|uniref:uncharacterized protein LOC134098305 n=1 Tax=Sardina pilchardus TaxID=27697 RepID=UPI002E11A99E